MVTLLNSCFGWPLRKGARIVAFVNAILSIIYILYYTWEYSISYGYQNHEVPNGPLPDSNVQLLDEVFFNYITLIFGLVGFSSMFANFGLQQATMKNATHKIYLWLLIGYVQFGTIITIEIVVLTKHTDFVEEFVVKLVMGFIFVDVVFVFQLLIVQSFYAEEKLVQENSYKRLRSELSSQVQEDEEFQNVELTL